MRKNIGTYDALLRITCGLTGLAWGTAKMVRKPRCNTTLLVTMLSAMKVAEGVTRFCPMLALLGKNTVNIQEKMMDSAKQTTTRMMNSSTGSAIKEIMEEVTSDDTGQDKS